MGAIKWKGYYYPCNCCGCGGSSGGGGGDTIVVPGPTPNDGKTEFYYKSDQEPRLGYSTADQPYDNVIVIPGPNDGQLTFKDHEGNELGVFTADQDGDTEITLPQGFSGDYNDLVNQPDIFDGKFTIKDSEGNVLGEFTANQEGDTEVVLPEGFSGSWDDLTDKPDCFPPCDHEHDFPVGDGCCIEGCQIELIYNMTLPTEPPDEIDWNKRGPCYRGKPGDTLRAPNPEDLTDWWVVLDPAKNDWIQMFGEQDYYETIKDELTWNEDDYLDPFPEFEKPSKDRNNNTFLWKYIWRGVEYQGEVRDVVAFASRWQNKGWNDPLIPYANVNVLNITEQRGNCFLLKHSNGSCQQGESTRTISYHRKDYPSWSSEYTVNINGNQGFVAYWSSFHGWFKTIKAGDKFRMSWGSGSDMVVAEVTCLEESHVWNEHTNDYILSFYISDEERDKLPDFIYPVPQSTNNRTTFRKKWVDEPDKGVFYGFPPNPVDGKTYARRFCEWVSLDSEFEPELKIVTGRLDPDKHVHVVEVHKAEISSLKGYHWRLSNIHCEGIGHHGVEQTLDQWAPFIRPYQSEGPYHWSDEDVLSFYIDLKAAADMPDGQKPPQFDEIYFDVEFENHSHRILDRTGKTLDDSYRMNPVPAKTILSESFGLQITPFDPANPDYSRY